jgi:hypothetical protein
MSGTLSLRFLRPFLSKKLPATQTTAYIRFFSSARCLRETEKNKLAIITVNTNNRLEKLKAADALHWPRIQQEKDVLTVSEYCHRYTDAVQPGTKLIDKIHVVRGMQPGWLKHSPILTT